MVTKRNIYTPVRELLQQCGWLSINQLIFFHNVLQVFKTRETKRPGYLYKKFSADFGAQTRMARSNLLAIEWDKNKQQNKIGSWIEQLYACGCKTVEYTANNLANVSQVNNLQVAGQNVDQRQRPNLNLM